MTDKTEKRRQALLDAARRLERTFATTDYAPPSTGMLYLGASFFKGDLASDAEAWLPAADAGLRDAPPALRLLHFLRAFVAGPTDTYALTCVEAAWELLRSPVKPDLTDRAQGLVADVYARLAFYSWSLDSALGALHVAQAAAALSRTADQGLHRVRYMQTCLAALRTAEEGYAMHAADPVRERAKALNALVDIGALAPEVRLVGHALLAEKTIADQGSSADREVLEHVKKQLKRPPRVADLDDREGVVRLDDDEVEQEPGLVVVPSLDHLPPGRTDKAAPRAEFEALAGRALPYAPLPDLAGASAALKSEFPWASAAVDRILGSLVGRRNLPPVLLHGRPGCGKNELARRVAYLLGVPLTEYACGGASDSSFGGTSRQWHSGRSSVPLLAVRQAMIANPVVLLDEIEKAGTSDRNGRLQDVLLGLLEGRRNYFDPYLETGVDLSGVSFLATANSLEAMRGSPLLDRFLKVEIPSPRAEDLDAIVAGILQRLREESDLDPRWLPALDPAEREVLKGAWRGGSIRPLRRAVERLLALRHDRSFAH